MRELDIPVCQSLSLRKALSQGYQGFWWGVSSVLSLGLVKEKTKCKRCLSVAEGLPATLLFLADNKLAEWLFHSKALKEKNRALFMFCARYSDLKKNYS